MKVSFTRSRAAVLVAFLLLLAVILAVPHLKVAEAGPGIGEYSAQFPTEAKQEQQEASLLVKQVVTIPARELKEIFLRAQTPTGSFTDKLYAYLYEVQSGAMLCETPVDAGLFYGGQEIAVPLHANVHPGEAYAFLLSSQMRSENFDPLDALHTLETDSLILADNAGEALALDVHLVCMVLPPLHIVLVGLIAAVILLLVVDIKITARPLRISLYVLGTPGCIFVWMTFCEYLHGTHFWAMDAKVVVLNVVLCLAVVLILFAVTTSLAAAVILTDVLVTVLSIANYYTIQFRQTPVTFSDLLSVSTALNVAGGYTYDITPAVFLAALQVVAVAIVACKLLRLRWSRGKITQMRMTGGTVLGLACLCTGGIILHEMSSYDWVVKMGLWPDSWEPSAACVSQGYPLYLTDSYVASQIQIPTEEALSASAMAIETYESEPAGNLSSTAPNIIFIMNESLADLESAGLLQTDKPVLPFIHSLKDDENAIVGATVVPVFGAGTCNSELEALTGSSYLFGLASNPYLLYTYSNMPSIAEKASAAGYHTTAVHINEASNWNRNSGFPRMGFETFISSSNNTDYLPLTSEFIAVGRGWSIDTYSYQVILEAMRRTEGRDFVFCVTIQNHGGYENGYLSKDPVRILPTAGNYPQAQEYLNLAHDSDMAFEALINDLKASDEPTIVMMFGDHLPSVEEEFLDHVLDANDPFARYTTPLVVWANYDLGLEPQEREVYTSANYLSLLLSEQAGLPLTGKEQFLQELREQFPVVSVYGAIAADGSVLDPQSAREQELIQLYEGIQYQDIKKHCRGAETFYYLQ